MVVSFRGAYTTSISLVYNHSGRILILLDYDQIYKPYFGEVKSKLNDSMFSEKLSNRISQHSHQNTSNFVTSMTCSTQIGIGYFTESIAVVLEKKLWMVTSTLLEIYHQQMMISGLYNNNQEVINVWSVGSFASYYKCFVPVTCVGGRLEVGQEQRKTELSRHREPSLTPHCSG